MKMEAEAEGAEEVRIHLKLEEARKDFVLNALEDTQPHAPRFQTYQPQKCENKCLLFEAT